MALFRRRTAVEAAPAGGSAPSSTARPPIRSATVDPAALMRIKSLELRARLAVEGFVRGLHRSPYHGFSAEFREYRQYTPGDDPRYLDWKLYARTDRDYVKRYEDETNLRALLVIDASRSMAYGSPAAGGTKGDYARTAAASLALFLTRQRDAVGVATFDERVTDYLPPRHPPGHFRRLLAVLGREPTGRGTSLDGPLEEVAALVRRRGLIVLFSDLLAPIDRLKARLGALRARGHEVVVFRVLDPTEVSFAFDGPGQFRDLETGRTLPIDPSIARADYLRRFADHAAEVNQACADLGVDLADATTDRPIERLLFDFLKARRRFSPGAGRRSGTGGAR